MPSAYSMSRAYQQMAMHAKFVEDRAGEKRALKASVILQGLHRADRALESRESNPAGLR